MTTRSRRFPRSLACLALVSTSLPAASLQVLPAPSPDLFAYALGGAATGSVAGYASDVQAPSGCMWEKSSVAYAGPLVLPLPAGGAGAEARWISANGALVAGYAALPASGNTTLNLAPTLWLRDAAGAYSALVLPRLVASPAEALASAASLDGSRIVGNDGPTETALIWRGSPAAGYYAQTLPLPAGAGGPSFATGIAGDGSRIVGRFTTADSLARAVVWTDTAGAYSALVLPPPSGAAQSFADALSEDGTVAGGTSENTGLYTPVKWNTLTGDVTPLESPSGNDATVLAISPDNLWLGGRATNRGTWAHEAVLWDAQGKAHSLASLAPDVAFGSFTPCDVVSIRLVSTGIYTVVGTGATNGTGATRAFVLENLQLGPTTPPPTTTDPTPTDPGTVVTDPGTVVTDPGTGSSGGTGDTGSGGTTTTPTDPGTGTGTGTTDPKTNNGKGGGNRRRGTTTTTTWSRFDEDAASTLGGARLR